MDGELNDPWSWVIETVTGRKIHEAVYGSIRNVPTQIVGKIGLVHRSAQVMIALPTGVAEVCGHFGNFPVRPMLPEIATAPKVPLFFRRRKALTDRQGVATLFRVVGFVALAEDGTPAQICGLRVFDDRIETRYMTQWPTGAARHTTGQNLVLGA